MNLSSAAMNYVETPFKFRGRSKRGVDCSGLLVVACADSGRMIPDRTDYGREPWNDGIEESLDELFHVADFPLQVDDVLLMCIPGRKKPQHIAIVAPYPAGGLGIIHARSEFKAVKFHYLDPDVYSHILKVYRGRR